MKKMLRARQITKIVLYNDAAYSKMKERLGLSMSIPEIKTCVKYFTSVVKYEPTVDELRFLDKLISLRRGRPSTTAPIKFTTSSEALNRAFTDMQEKGSSLSTTTPSDKIKPLPYSRLANIADLYAQRTGRAPVISNSAAISYGRNEQCILPVLDTRSASREGIYVSEILRHSFAMKPDDVFLCVYSDDDELLDTTIRSAIQSGVCALATDIDVSVFESILQVGTGVSLNLHAIALLFDEYREYISARHKMTEAVEAATEPSVGEGACDHASEECPSAEEENTRDAEKQEETAEQEASAQEATAQNEVKNVPPVDPLEGYDTVALPYILDKPERKTYLARVTRKSLSRFESFISGQGLSSLRVGIAVKGNKVIFKNRDQEVVSTFNVDYINGLIPIGAEIGRTPEGYRPTAENHPVDAIESNFTIGRTEYCALISKKEVTDGYSDGIYTVLNLVGKMIEMGYSLCDIDVYVKHLFAAYDSPEEKEKKVADRCSALAGVYRAKAELGIGGAGDCELLAEDTQSSVDGIVGIGYANSSKAVAVTELEGMEYKKFLLKPSLTEDGLPDIENLLSLINYLSTMKQSGVIGSIKYVGGLAPSTIIDGYEGEDKPLGFAFLVSSCQKIMGIQIP